MLIILYVDAGYSEHVDSKSHTGIFVTVGKNGGPVLVKSFKQNLELKELREP